MAGPAAMVVDIPWSVYWTVPSELGSFRILATDHVLTRAGMNTPQFINIGYREVIIYSMTSNVTRKPPSSPTQLLTDFEGI